MKLYTNECHEIVGKLIAPESYRHEYEVEDTFGNQWCDTALMGFCYAPSYELDFNEDGTTKKDVNGLDIFKVDNNGKWIQNGMAFYPFIDLNIILSIQDLYEKML